jgi:hypothetical protein
VFADSLNPYTATGTAIAESIETAETNLLEPGRLDVSSLMLCLDEFHCLFPVDSPAGLGVVIQDEIDERLPHDHAYLGRRARSWIRQAATTFIDSDIGRAFEDNISGRRERNDLFQVPQGNVLFHGNDGLGIVEGEDFEVSMVRPSPSFLRTHLGQGSLFLVPQIVLGPASVHIELNQP